MEKKKTRIAFFDFADCEGCQLQVTYLYDALLDLLENVEIVNFREAISERSDDYDLAIVEGSITRKHDEDRIIGIRRNAKILVAYGACATIGGVNGMRKIMSGDEAKKIVYPGREFPLEAGEPRAVDQVVKVDAYIHGCPVNNTEVATVLKQVLMGNAYNPPTHAVCVECKLKENVCLFDRGQVCMGPVTRAGCGAWCTSYGNICYGCRGLLDNPNTESQKDVLEKNGYTPDMLKQKFSLYNSCKNSNS